MIYGILYKSDNRSCYNSSLPVSIFTSVISINYLFITTQFITTKTSPKLWLVKDPLIVLRSWKAFQDDKFDFLFINVSVKTILTFIVYNNFLAKLIMKSFYFNWNNSHVNAAGLWLKVQLMLLVANLFIELQRWTLLYQSII